MKLMRIYIDTSVLGGYFDREFQKPTRVFMEAVFQGRIKALISDTLAGELSAAPDNVKKLFQRIMDIKTERLALSGDAENLRDAYLKAKIVSAKYADDALHVAHATLARADVIVSWNFKHLVNPIRIREFNGVNMIHGYGSVIIMTPADVIRILEESDEER